MNRDAKRPAAGQAAQRLAGATPQITVSRRRLWLFRAAAALLGPLLFFTAVELSLRLAGHGHSSSFFLPSRLEGKPMMVQNDRFAVRFLGPDMARQPWPFTLSREKDPKTVRVFVFGESAAFGDPQPEFGLARMLECLLVTRFPAARFEVINTAMTAINSHAILPIAREAASQKGDIWILYAGNNEVVGPFGAGTIFGRRGASLSFIRLSQALKATRTAQWLQNFLRRFDKNPSSKEWGGMQMFLQHQVQQDDPLLATVYSNFHRNLADFLEAGRRSGAKIVVSTVASNLRDCAPFASLHRAGLLPTQLAEWEAFVRQGEDAQRAGRFAEALDQYRRAEKVDDRFAELHFRLGQCYAAQGQSTEALREWVLARDLDTLRFRCDSRLNGIIRQAASDRERDGIRFVDGERDLDESGPDRSGDHRYFYEHVHLTFEGNYRLALRFADEVAKMLPEDFSRQAKPGWASAEECAGRLGWTDFSRYEAAGLILGRLADPPFTAQLDHAEQTGRWKRELQQLGSAALLESLSDAAARCRVAAEQSPGDWVLQMNLARVLQKAGDFSAASGCWQKVLQFVPQYVEGWQELGGLLAQQRHDDEASQAFGQAIKLQPDSVIALTAWGELEARQGKHAEARRHFERALKVKPWMGPAHLGLGKELEALGKNDEASAHFQAALKTRMNTPSAYVALAQFCFERGWLEPAVTNFNDALRLNPSDAATHVNLGVTLGLLGRREEALAHYQEAARLDPRLAEAHARLGLEFGLQGNDAGAVEQFGEAVRLKPELLEARVNLAVALAKLGRTAEAREQFQEVLRRSPTNAAALRYLGSRATASPASPKPL